MTRSLRSTFVLSLRVLAFACLCAGLTQGCQRKMPKKEEEEKKAQIPAPKAQVPAYGSVAIKFVGAKTPDKPGQGGQSPKQKVLAAIYRSVMSDDSLRTPEERREAFEERLEKLRDDFEEEQERQQDLRSYGYSRNTSLYADANDVTTTDVEADASGDPTPPDPSGDPTPPPPTDPDPSGDPTPPPPTDPDPSGDPTPPSPTDPDPSGDPTPPPNPPAPPGGGIPAGVKVLKVTISAADIPTPIAKEFPVGEAGDFKIEKIPAGAARKFAVEALGDEEGVLFSGEATADIKPSDDNVVEIAMKKVGGGDQGNAGLVLMWPGE